MLMDFKNMNALTTSIMMILCLKFYLVLKMSAYVVGPLSLNFLKMWL